MLVVCPFALGRRRRARRARRGRGMVGVTGGWFKSFVA